MSMLITSLRDCHYFHITAVLFTTVVNTKCKFKFNLQRINRQTGKQITQFT